MELRLRNSSLVAVVLTMLAGCDVDDANRQAQHAPGDAVADARFPRRLEQVDQPAHEVHQAIASEDADHDTDDDPIWIIA